MKYPYKILPQSLHATADAAMDWFIANWGVKTKNIHVEEALHSDVSLRPTFHAQLDDGHMLCVEVSTKTYDNTLNTAVLQCRHEGLPIKLFVAVPKGINDPNYSDNLRTARSAGVGLLEVDDQSGSMIRGALSTSLSGVRNINLAEYPARFRNDLHQAIQVYLDGEPSKACSLIYDEIEACTRTLAMKCQKKKLWPNNKNFDVSVVPWAKLLENFNEDLARTDSLSRLLKPSLISRVIGVTPHRNESGHKPKTQLARMKRDQELRTRFEGAFDLFKDLLDASKGFRL